MVFRGVSRKVLAKVLAVIHRYSWATDEGFRHASRGLIEGLKIDARGLDILMSEHRLNASDRCIFA